jgi:hypothetical protein
MVHLIKLISMVVSLLILGMGLQGCLPRFTQDDIKHLRRVAVVSLTEETLRGVNQGTTVFQHSEFSGDLRPWSLNQFTEQVMGEVLRACSEVEIAKIPKDVISLFSKYRIIEVTAIRDEGAFGGIRDEILQLGRAYDLDLIVLILDYSLTTYARYQKLTGYTLYASTFLCSGGIDLYVVHEVRALDLHRQRAVNRLPFLNNIRDNELSLSFWIDPEKLVWKDKFESYTNDEKLFLVSVVKKKIRSQIVAALDDMGFARSEHSSCASPVLQN